jgi:hypothetical protein
VSKTRITYLHPQLDGKVEHYVRTVKEHLQKVFASRQMDWDSEIIHLSPCLQSMGFTPGSQVFRRELQLPCDLLFWTPPDKKRPTVNHASNLVDHLHNIHNIQPTPEASR